MRKFITASMLAMLLAPGLAVAQPGGGHDHGDQRGPGQEHPGNGNGNRGGYDRHGPGGPGGYDRPGNGYGRPDNWRQFRRGERFDRARAWRYAPIDDYRSYRGLRRPPRGYHWVRNGDDAVLVGITSGIVASVITGALLGR